MTTTLSGGVAIQRRAHAERGLTAWMLSTVALAGVTSLFAIAHWQYWQRTGDPKGIVVALEEMIVVAIATSRRRPITTSRRIGDWATALLGSYCILLMRPGGAAVFGYEWLWTAPQMLGSVLAIAALFRLGRNFGVIAANRGITTTGLYRIVRHPIYASYVIGIIGYVLAAPTARNVVVATVMIGAQILRITAEERLLGETAAYRDYQAQVPYRLIPAVF